MFIVQESIHADHVSRHETREEAITAIEELIREGLAERGEFNIREIDDSGKTVRVFPVAGAGRGPDELPVLTAREREVLLLIADGLSNDEIGQRLRISSNTVRSHVRKVLAKLEADTKAQAVATARRESLVA